MNTGKRYLVNGKAVARRQNPPPALVPLPLTAEQIATRERRRKAALSSVAKRRG